MTVIYHVTKQSIIFIMNISHLFFSEESRVSLFVGSEVRSIDIQPGNRALTLESQTLLGRESGSHLRACVGVTGSTGGPGTSGRSSSFPTIHILIFICQMNIVPNSPILSRKYASEI